MGQGKEAAQVAMKHRIANLQEEAAVWDAMPPSLLVVPTVTVNTVDHDAATLKSLARHLSEATRKSVLT